MKKTAQLSDCQTYRYNLFRIADNNRPAKIVTFIGLNPSTADAFHDDPTIRRCLGFMTAWGYNSLCMVNLFAYRATVPTDMKQSTDPIGPDNDKTILSCIEQSDLVVAAWGNHGSFLDRDEQVLSMINKPIYCLGRNASGTPKHPLYIKKDKTLELLKDATA